MGDDKAPNLDRSANDILKNFMQNLPGYMEAINKQYTPNEQAKLAAAQAVSPGYQELQTSLLEKFAPRLTRAGAESQALSNQIAAESDVNLLRGSGGELIRSLSEMDRQLNPETYKVRTEGANKLSELLGSINLNDANPEAERLVSQENERSGLTGVNSTTNTVANALQFGNAMQGRRNALSQAINTASQFLPSAQFGAVNPGAVIGRQTSPIGMTQFSGVKNPTEAALGAGEGMYSSLVELRRDKNEQNAQRRDAFDKITPDSISL